MQQVTNCIVIDNNHILVLKKPRHGWYAIPGGKKEQGETIQESVIREYREETALVLKNPKLAGVFTFSIMEGQTLIKEWMMYTFICRKYSGELTAYCREGELEWVPVNQVLDLPMAEGDQMIYKYLLANEQVVSGAFSYTAKDELINFRIDPIEQ
ncbi:MAG: NUDIX domain-containing protein [Bacillota bacterium]|uniref:8-oxo-dGTP diphosphatase n=1 Tax=Virgibacillus salarius TaxID=447199 RepID=A0A941IB07_9BACI|nr:MULTISPECIES: 8-oxo-dGTP diphosphatase [Bacillaceae]NAZ08643.1 NUDIX domain-containing protein [Agaribacter marinus]MBR7795931.1 8-oxo-dGTP diphosphatase [Virgibacillus salarius]MCC2248708.1 8-oxo-dGTP diphosphatase [Virgibacillus sp. AGTR]MDY7043996.1 8-oxo-dGTP diphosphatase [Virgibacillus sp. M23]QRZ17997.1 8-oxo-dGTP diphosphatase [Virgibacillus sp. AGTR]